MGKKVGRNDPCPCGSGKKYKNCCLGKQEKTDNIISFPNKGSLNSHKTAEPIESIDASFQENWQNQNTNQHFEKGDNSAFRNEDFNDDEFDDINEYDIQQMIEQFGFSSKAELLLALQAYYEMIEERSSQPHFDPETIPSFEEFLETKGNKVTEKLKELKDILENREFSSEEGMQAFLSDYPIQQNNLPVDDFFGLSLAQMKKILDRNSINSVAVKDIVKISDSIKDEDVLKAPIIQKLLFIADWFHESDGRLPLTSSRNIRPKYVQSYYQRFFADHPILSKINREYRAVELQVLRFFLSDHNYIEERKTFIRLNEDGLTALSRESSLSSLYKEILVYLLEKFAWTYLVPELDEASETFEFIQDSAIFSLFILKEIAENYISHPYLYDNFLRAFPQYDPYRINRRKEDYSDSHISEEYEQESLKMIVYRKLFLEFFAENLGLLEIRTSPFIGTQHRESKKSMLDKNYEFDFSDDSEGKYDSTDDTSFQDQEVKQGKQGEQVDQDRQAVKDDQAEFDEYVKSIDFWRYRTTPLFHAVFRWFDEQKA